MIIRVSKVIVVMILMMSAVISGSGADLTWLNSPADANWNTSSANWTGAVAWPNTMTDNATFGNSSQTSLTVGNGITASNLFFNSSNYVLAGGTLDLFGNFFVALGASAVIESSITHSKKMIKSGSGTLTVDPGVAGQNSFASLTVTQGILRIHSGTNTIANKTKTTESSTNGLWISGGALLVDGGLLRTTNNGAGEYSAVVKGGGHLMVTNGTIDLRGNGGSAELLNAFNGPGMTTVENNGLLQVDTLRIAHYKTGIGASNAVNINVGGVLAVNRFYYDYVNMYNNGTNVGVVNFNGGKVVVQYSRTNFFGDGDLKWTSIVARVLSGGVIIDSQGYDVTIQQAFQSGVASDGGLTKLSGGTLRLTGANNYNGGTMGFGGSLILSNAAGECVQGPILISNNCAVEIGFSNQISDASIVTFPTQAVGRLQLQGWSETVGGVQDFGGSGARIVEAAQDYAGNKPATLTISVPWVTNFTFSGYVRDAAFTNNSPLSITKDGVGTQTFSGDANFVSYSGATLVNSGVLEFRGTNSVANKSAITLNGGSVMFSGGGTRSLGISGTAGALIKAGSNTLTLVGLNTYAGSTIVNEGVLKVSNSLAVAGSSGFTLNAGVLDLNGLTLTNAVFDGSDGVASNGTLVVTNTVSPGSTNHIRVMTVLGTPRTLAGTLWVDVAANGDCDQLAVTGGSLSVSNLSLRVVADNLLNRNYNYTIVQCIGGVVTGRFVTDNLPSPWMISYQPDRIILYPHRGALLIVQ